MEYGIVIAQGIQHLRRELPVLVTTETLAELGREVVKELRERLLELDRRITDYDHQIEQVATQNEATRRVMQVEGIERISFECVPAGFPARSEPFASAHFERRRGAPKSKNAQDYAARAAESKRK